MALGIYELQAVLALGNALNGSTFRGGARGFHLDALLKVAGFYGYGIGY